MTEKSLKWGDMKTTVDDFSKFTRHPLPPYWFEGKAEDDPLVYGPFPSRRLGKSLGLNPSPRVCSYDCVYCQAGKKAKIIARAQDYIKSKPFPPTIDDFRAQLDPYLPLVSKMDALTESGSGEPTLNPYNRRILEELLYIKPKGVKLVVITNSSQIKYEETRKALSLCDEVHCKLEAATESIFKQYNRPHPAIKIAEKIDSLKIFSREYGNVRLSTLLSKSSRPGIQTNFDREELEKIANITRVIEPICWDIFTLDRKPQCPWILPLTNEELEDTRELFKSYFDRVIIHRRVTNTEEENKMIKEVFKNDVDLVPR